MTLFKKYLLISASFVGLVLCVTSQSKAMYFVGEEEDDVRSLNFGTLVVPAGASGLGTREEVFLDVRRRFMKGKRKGISKNPPIGLFKVF